MFVRHKDRPASPITFPPGGYPTFLPNGLKPHHGGQSFSIDFLSPHFGQPKATITRPSIKYIRDENGNLTAVAAGILPVEYAYDKTKLGVLLEGLRQNILLGSNDLTNNSYWTANDVNVGTGVVGPDGVTEDAFSLTDANSVTGFFQAKTITAGAVHGVSAFIQRGNTDWARLRFVDGGGNGVNAWFNLGTGQFGTVAKNGTGGLIAGSQFAYRYAQDWWRIGFAGCVGPGVTDASIWLVTANGDASTTRAGIGAEINASRFQCEVGSFCSSYIPTTTVPVSRGADVIVYDLPFFQNNDGFLFAEFYFPITPINGRRVIVQLSEASSVNDWIFLSHRAAANDVQMQHVRNGSLTAFAEGGNVQGGAVHNVATSWKSTGDALKQGFYFFIDEEYYAKKAMSTPVPGCAKLRVGDVHDGVNPLFGHIRRIFYDPNIPAEFYNHEIWDAGDIGPGYLLFEDGVGRLTFEDGSGALLQQG